MDFIDCICVEWIPVFSQTCPQIPQAGIKPSATKTLFEKRVLDSQKLLSK